MSDEERTLVPPKDNRDPNVLGAGGSKFAWKSDRFRGVVINSFDEQRRFAQPRGVSWGDWNIQYNKDMKTEYEFTKYIRGIFGDVIPWVDPIPSYLFNDRKFRYQKEECGKVKMNLHFFDVMFRFQDVLLDEGWVFLDMKPDNLGTHITGGKEKFCLVDTDPRHFYRVPPHMLPHFRVASYMIILLVTRLCNVPRDLLLQKMREKGLTADVMRFTYNYLHLVKMNDVTTYGNSFLTNETFTLTDTENPLALIGVYGHQQGLPLLLALAQQLNPVEPVIPSAPPSAPPSVEQPLNLDESFAKVSQNDLDYSLNTALNQLDTGTPVFYPRTPRKRQTKRRTARVHARNLVTNQPLYSLNEMMNRLPTRKPTGRTKRVTARNQVINTNAKNSPRTTIKRRILKRKENANQKKDYLKWNRGIKI
jgi:hypothetical protein